MDSSTDAPQHHYRGPTLPPLRLHIRQGQPALFVPRWTRAARLGRALLLGITAVALAGAVWAALARSWALMLLLVIGAGVVGGFLVRDLRRMPYDGGVWLTPSGVTHRWAGRTWSVPWDDLAGAHLDRGDGDLLVDVRGEDAPQVLSTHLLVLAPGALTLLLEAYRDDPGRRPELGTPASLARAEQVRRDAQPADYRPPVHGAPRPSAGALFAATLVLVALLLALVALGRATG